MIRERLAALVGWLGKRDGSSAPAGAPAPAPAASAASQSPEPPAPSTPPGEEPFGTGYV